MQNSELRRRRFDRSHLTADDAVGFGRALVDVRSVMLIFASDEKLAENFSTKTNILWLSWRRDEEVHTSCLVADLNAQRGSDVEPAVGIHAHRAYFQRELIQMGALHEIKVLSMLKKRRLRAEMKTTNSFIVPRDVKQALIR